MVNNNNNNGPNSEMFRSESVIVARPQHHQMKAAEVSQPSALHQLQASVKTENNCSVKNEHGAKSVKQESDLAFKSELSEAKSEVKTEGLDEKFTLDNINVENRGEPEKSPLTSPLDTFRDKLLIISRWVSRFGSSRIRSLQ